MSDFKTYKKQKRVYFCFAIMAYLIPLIVAISCFFPFFDYNIGYKVAFGFVIALVHMTVFGAGLWHSVRAHYPMLSPLPFLIIMMYTLCAFDFFQKFVHALIVIEIIAAAGMILSAVFWTKYRKYKRFADSVKAVVSSGIIKEH